VKPIFAACYFGTGQLGDNYGRLAKVLEFTARRHCPEWDVRVVRIDPPDYHSAMGNQSHVWNTQKLEWWLRVVEEAPDGAQVLIIDGDMVVPRPRDDVWGQDFDVAYTTRMRSRLPLNGGVVFLRVNERSRTFMRQWWEANVRFLKNAAEHQPWRQKYAGINQSALGFVLEQKRHGCTLVQLPCSEWNCCEWDTFDPKRTRLLHVKSQLRRAVFGMCPTTYKVRPLVALWKKLERESRGETEPGPEEQPLPNVRIVPRAPRPPLPAGRVVIVKSVMRLGRRRR
jgi:hypothetical protein